MNINVRYHDELFMIIETSQSIEYELRDEFSFFANNYKFNPKYKYGMWDGKIRLYNSRDRTLYIGLLYDLFKFAKKNGYSISISKEDKAKFQPVVEYDEKKIEKFESEQCIYKLKHYQKASVKEAIKNNKTLILSPTGSGKSLIIYTIIRYLLDSGFINKNKRMLINVPNISLVSQLYSDFEEYTNDDWNIKDFVTLAGGKHVEDSSKCICISTWQTTIKKKPEYFENIVGYILDEAHQATANEISRIFERLTKCVFKMGTTGTLDGTDMHELGMRARFGKLYRAATTKQLMDSGDLAKLNITCKYLEYDKNDVKEMWGKLRGLEPTKKYQAEIDYIVNNEKRNQYLIDLAFSQEQNTLMIFNFVEKHGKLLLDKMIGLEDEKLTRVYFIYGGIGGDEREYIRTTLDKKSPVWYDLHFGKSGFIRIKAKDNVQLDDGEYIYGYNLNQTKRYKISKKWFDNATTNKYNKFTENVDDLTVTKIIKQYGSSVLLASYGTLAVGVNIKNLHTLIFCHPTKGQIRLLQTIGRILRKANDKNQVEVIDIVDNFERVTKKSKFRNTLLKQFVTRLEIYEKQEFDYDIEQVKL